MFIDFRKEGKGREKKRGRDTDRLPPACAPTRDGTPQPFGIWDNTSAT